MISQPVVCAKCGGVKKQIQSRLHADSKPYWRYFNTKKDCQHEWQNFKEVEQ